MSDEITVGSVSTKPVYTYIGRGEDSPLVIDFMGKQRFVRGKAAEVTNPDVLAKIARHPCFVEGTVEADILHDSDEAARKEAELQRKKDRDLNAAWKKKHNKE